MGLHQKYGLRKVINACGKLTRLTGSVVLPAVAEASREAMGSFFDLDELQERAGKVIAAATGAEWGPPARRRALPWGPQPV